MRLPPGRQGGVSGEALMQQGAPERVVYRERGEGTAHRRGAAKASRTEMRQNGELHLGAQIAELKSRRGGVGIERMSADVYQ